MRLRHRMLLCVSVIVLPVLTVAAVASGQEGESPAFSEEIDVAEVLIDVLVTDSDGRVVVGLGPDDFSVEDDGKPVELTGVQFYSSAELIGSSEAVTGRGANIDQVPRDRYFIVYLQLQQRVAGQVPGIMSRQMEAIRDLEGWIADILQPEDWAAIVAFDTRLHVVTDFTRDLAVLRRSLNEVGSGLGRDQDWPSRQTEPGSNPSLLAHLPSGRDLGRATNDDYEAMEAIARAAGSIRARKVLVFVGRGIGEIGSGGFWEPDPRYYNPMIETLNDNNVAVYPLDLMPSASRHSLEQSLYNIASETGGTFSRQYTSFTTPLQQIARQNSGYYLLSYREPIENESPSYHRVTVRARNPRLRLEARQGYLTGEPDTSSQ